MSDSQVIPEAAVDAGAAKLVEMRGAGEHSSFEYARAVLEAAAPHMLAAMTVSKAMVVREPINKEGLGEWYIQAMEKRGWK